MKHVKCFDSVSSVSKKCRRFRKVRGVIRGVVQCGRKKLGWKFRKKLARMELGGDQDGRGPTRLEIFYHFGPKLASVSKMNQNVKILLKMKIEHGIKEASTEIFLLQVDKINNQIILVTEYLFCKSRKLS